MCAVAAPAAKTAAAAALAVVTAAVVALPDVHRFPGILISAVPKAPVLAAVAERQRAQCDRHGLGACYPHMQCGRVACLTRTHWATTGRLWL